MKPFLLVLALVATLPAQRPRVDVHFDAGEAEAVLKIVAMRRSGQTPTQDDWLMLTSTTGYQRLKAREQSFHAPMDEDAFKRFVESDDLARHADDQRRTVDAWAR